MRFTWTFTLIPEISQSFSFRNYQVMIFVLAFIEAFRRAQWALLRVENENVNNFEKYRTFLEVPEVQEDEEGNEEIQEAVINVPQEVKAS
jgi:predicted AAA+ superfamily ATPase